MVNWDSMEEALEEQKATAEKLQEYAEKKLEELIEKVKESRRKLTLQ